MADNRITFGTLTPQGIVNVREISQKTIGRCPHFILDADHYRESGACYCDDPTRKEMKAWGYRWSKRLSRWN